MISKPTPKPKSPNKIVGTILLTLAVLFLMHAQSAFWINHTIFNKEVFTSTVETIIAEESNRDAIATAIVDKALADKPVVRKVAGDRAISLVSSLLGTDVSSQVISNLLNKTYTYMTTSNRQDVAIDLTAIKTPLSGVVSFAESRGNDVKFDPTNIPDEVVLIKSDDFPDISGYLTIMLWLAPLLWLGALASFALYIYLGRAVYAKKVYFAGTAAIVASVFGLLIGPIVPPPIASLVQNTELRVVVQNLLTAFFQPFQVQMTTTIIATSFILIIFNQRFNLLSLIKKLEGKISKR